MKRSQVTGCGMCPFGHGGYGLTFCIALTLSDGETYRDVPTKYLREDRRPPRWCPLRKADHLVTLRVK